MKKKDTVRLISFCAAAVLVAVGFLIKSYQTSNRYKLEIQNTYSRSLDELNASVNNISVILEKAQYVTTAKQISSMAAQLMGESETAKTALSQLPAGENELSALNKFLSQVGNYAMSVSKDLIQGKEITPEYNNNISVLSDTASKVSKVINSSQISYNNLNYWAGELDRKLGSVVSEESLAASFGELEENLADYPTLVYDGPYSDHILEKEPQMIKNAQKVSELDALAKAAEAADTSKNKLNFDGLTIGKIPAYRFSNDSVAVTISQSGGFPVYMRKTRTVGENILSYNQALEKAKRYLSKNGQINLTETYYFTDEGICVINFAFLDGRTICYTDLIKVGVAMDNGEIMLYEASGYLTNHTDRAFETAAVTAEEAAEVVSDKLTINETALALIPTESAGEVRCYEFVCSTADNQEVLVYINAINLEEEKILILLKSDGGTLTK